MLRIARYCVLLSLCTVLGCENSPEQTVALTDSADAAPAAVASQPPAAAEHSGVNTAVPVVESPVRTENLPTPQSLTEDDWPQYRGQMRDNHVHSTVRLARAWPEEGPPVLWQTKVAQGYAAPSVVGEKVFLNDYDEATNEWLVRCLGLEDGEELWTYRVSKRIRPNHAITRSAPATDGGFVFSLDPKCELHCLDARDGSLIWKKQLPQLYESPIPAWYNGQCPLLDGDQLIVATGGKALLVALDKKTGQPIWETPNSEQFVLSHSSIMPVELEGVRQYTYTTLKGPVGISAETGELLWHFPWKFNTAVATSPLPLEGGRFLLTSGYHAQTVICQVQRQGDKWVAEEVASLAPPPSGWNSEIHTPVVYKEHVYGVGKKKRGLWTCLDFSGAELWTSGGEASFGMGGYVWADGMFFILEDKTGTLRLLDADADAYHELASASLLEGPDVWAPPVISRGKLLIRDLGRLVCVDVSERSSELANRSARFPNH